MSKTCAICEEPFTPTYNTTQRTCAPACAIVYARNKKREKQRKEATKAVKTLKQQDIRHQHKLTQAAFNRLRILQEFKWYRDHDQEPRCISCGKTNMDWCAGHYKTVGARSDLRYNPKNVYLQCNFACNCSLSGNLTRYRVGLLNRVGEEAFDELERYLEVRQETNWTWETLAAFRAQCRKEIKELE